MKRFITNPVIALVLLFGYSTTPCTSQSIISGHIYNDLNNNGSYDPGEGVKLVKVWLLDKAAVSPYYLVYPVQTATSSADGSYSFTNVSNGNYQIRINMLSLSNTAIIDLGYTLTHAVADNNSYNPDEYPNGVTDLSVNTPEIRVRRRPHHELAGVGAAELVAGEIAVAGIRVEMRQLERRQAVVGAPLGRCDCREPRGIGGERTGRPDAGAERDRDDGQRH